MQEYAIYLRKSRIDVDLEKQGEGETLSRHRKILLDLAEKRGYYISKIYEEVVSGETIISRPQMQALMSDVEKGKFTGVLVMEIERLARGDTIDQGLVAQTFKYSNTLIITPLKTYDPSNEFDEEFFEFGLFMSRREYKTINRRLQRGREQSAKEGKYLGSVPPYGYRIIPCTGQKGNTLEPIPEQAAIVQMIYDLYINGIDGERLGVMRIARYLNGMNIPSPTGNKWETSGINHILSNPVYIGKIRWQYHRTVKYIENGVQKVSAPYSRTNDYIYVDGLHPPIISDNQYNAVQDAKRTRPPVPVNGKSCLQNPLSGLVFCKVCGRAMIRRKCHGGKYPDYLMCPSIDCPNVASKLYLVENKIIDGLRDWIAGYEISINRTDLPRPDTLTKIISEKQKALATLQKQLNNTYDLLEQGVYSIEIFGQRKADISERISTMTIEIEELTAKAKKNKRSELMKSEAIPKAKSILQAYEETNDIKVKNALLREVVAKVEYFKQSSGVYRDTPCDDFEIDLFPRLPHCE